MALTGKEQLRQHSLFLDLENIFDMDHEPTPLEFEALMDIRHGLNLVAHFANGTRVLAMGFGFPQTLNVRDQLRLSSIVDVTYLPGAASRLGEMYQTASDILGRRDVNHVYESYAGLSDGRERPLAPTEELALKWATFHLSPNDEFVNLPRRLNQPKKNLVRLINLTRERNLAEASRIISGRFGSIHTERILFRLVRPFLVRHFLHLRKLVEGLDAN